MKVQALPFYWQENIHSPKVKEHSYFEHLAVKIQNIAKEKFLLFAFAAASSLVTGLFYGAQLLFAKSSLYPTLTAITLTGVCITTVLLAVVALKIIFIAGQTFLYSSPFIVSAQRFSIENYKNEFDQAFQSLQKESPFFQEWLTLEPKDSVSSKKAFLWSKLKRGACLGYSMDLLNQMSTNHSLKSEDLLKKIDFVKVLSKQIFAEICDDLTSKMIEIQKKGNLELYQCLQITNIETLFKEFFSEKIAVKNSIGINIGEIQCSLSENSEIVKNKFLSQIKKSQFVPTQEVNEHYPKTKITPLNPKPFPAETIFAGHAICIGEKIGHSIFFQYSQGNYRYYDGGFFEATDPNTFFEEIISQFKKYPQFQDTSKSFFKFNIYAIAPQS